MLKVTPMQCMHILHDFSLSNPSLDALLAILCCFSLFFASTHNSLSLLALLTILRHCSLTLISRCSPSFAAAHYSLLLVSLVRSQCLGLSPVGGCSPPFEAGWQTGKGKTIEGMIDI